MKDRFIYVYQQGSARGIDVIVDTKTGVQYLFMHQGYAGGLSPLLDAEGKPVISKEYASQTPQEH